MSEPTKLEQAIAARRAKKADQNAFEAAKAGAAAVADLVPDRQHSNTPEDAELDRLIDGLDIVESYNRWIGKMKPIRRPGQTEGVMVSCPVPGHRDEHPSAWMNTVKKAWFCIACQKGGDTYDLAAYGLGFTDYTGSAFHDLRRAIAGDLGYVVQRSSIAGVPDSIYLPEPVAATLTPNAAPVAEPAHVPDKPVLDTSGLWDNESRAEAPVTAADVRRAFFGEKGSSKSDGPTPSVGQPTVEPASGHAPGDREDNASILHVPTGDAGSGRSDDESATEAAEDNVIRADFGKAQPSDSELESLLGPGIAWRELVPEVTFLRAYLEQATVDSTPEEYHFWNGLIAIGLAASRRITLWDEDLIYGNLMLCLLGHTGMRKSRSIRVMTRLIDKACPFMPDDATGILDIQGAASGEVLISMFDHKEAPTPGVRTPPKSTGKPITGYVNFSEMSALTSRAARQGSVIKDVLMQLADSDTKISTSSLTRGKLEAKNPFGCVQTTTQPESLKTLLDSEQDVNSGFLNRWIFAPGTEKNQPGVGGVVVDISTCVWPYQEILRQADRVIDWTDEAKMIWEDFFQNTVRPAKRGQFLLGRIDLTLKKLFLLFAINENLDAVTGDVVDRVLKLYPYLIKSYNATSENLQVKTVSGEMYEDIMAQIKRLSGTPGYEYGPTKSQIIDRIKRKKNFDPLLVDRIFNMFKDNRADEIEVNVGKPTGPGRKSEHYKWIGAA